MARLLRSRALWGNLLSVVSVVTARASGVIPAGSGGAISIEDIFSLAIIGFNAYAAYGRIDARTSLKTGAPLQ